MAHRAIYSIKSITRSTVVHLVGTHVMCVGTRVTDTTRFDRLGLVCSAFTIKLIKKIQQGTTVILYIYPWLVAPTFICRTSPRTYFLCLHQLLSPQGRSIRNYIRVYLCLGYTTNRTRMCKWNVVHHCGRRRLPALSLGWGLDALRYVYTVLQIEWNNNGKMHRIKITVCICI